MTAPPLTLPRRRGPMTFTPLPSRAEEGMSIDPVAERPPDYAVLLVVWADRSRPYANRRAFNVCVDWGVYETPAAPISRGRLSEVYPLVEQAVNKAEEGLSRREKVIESEDKYRAYFGRRAHWRAMDLCQQLRRFEKQMGQAEQAANRHLPKWIAHATAVERDRQEDALKRREDRKRHV